MAPRTRWFVLLVSTPLVAVVTIGGLIGTPRAASQIHFENLPVFRDVLQLVLGAYVEEVDVDRVMDGAMRGLADGLDSSSAFLTPDEVRALESNAPPAQGDVGLMVTRQVYLRVLGVRDGSPAARAGLQSGDYIRQIGDRPTRDMSAVTGGRLLRGEPGSKVSVTVIRGNLADPHELELTREVLGGPAVTTSMVEGVARVRISTFAGGVGPRLQQAFAGLAKAAVPGAVIDLRGLGNGTPEDGIQAARLFVKSGTIGIRAGRSGDPVRTEAGAGDGVITMPLVLLVSNGTAQAAEVFAAALSGNGRADLVGQLTAGIAGRQKLVRLPDGHGLWLTYERYLKIDGSEPIHERGLTPDLVVPMPLVGFDELSPATDAPLARAIAHLKSKR